MKRLRVCTKGVGWGKHSLTHDPTLEPRTACRPRQQQTHAPTLGPHGPRSSIPMQLAQACSHPHPHTPCNHTPHRAITHRAPTHTMHPTHLHRDPTSKHSWTADQHHANAPRHPGLTPIATTHHAPTHPLHPAHLHWDLMHPTPKHSRTADQHASTPCKPRSQPRLVLTLTLIPHATTHRAPTHPLHARSQPRPVVPLRPCHNRACA
jgi:hypothetical protein